MTSSMVTLRDGRALCVHEFGDHAGRPAVFFHGGGLGATGLFAASADQVAREQGLRLLAPDRPGLGGSAPALSRTVLDWPEDVAAMADALRLDSFPVVGYSGGAAFALACAWRLGDRVTFVRLTSAVPSRAMITEDRAVPLKTRLGTWWFSVMPDFLLGAMFRKIANGMKHAPEKTGQAFLRRLPACERPVMELPAYQKLLRDCLASALAQGTAAAIHDLHLIFGKWGVPLPEIRQEVTLWHGEQDATALPQTAATLASKLTRAELHLVPECGHLTTWLCHAGEVLGGL